MEQSDILSLVFLVILGNPSDGHGHDDVELIDTIVS